MTRWIFLMIINAVAFSCGNSDSGSDSDSDSTTDTSTYECEPVDHVCELDVWYICTDGEWSEWINCEAQGENCGNYTGSCSTPWGHYYENFGLYPVGENIVESSGDPWQTWSNPTLPEEDAQVSNDQASSGKKSLRIATDNHVLLVRDLEVGHWIVELELFVVTGKSAYYSFQQSHPDDDSSVPGFEVFFNPSGQGTLSVGKEEYLFEFPVGQWFSCEHNVDIDGDTVRVTIDEIDIHSWVWSTAQGENPPARLDAIEFYGVPDLNSEASYYVDDINERQI